MTPTHIMLTEQGFVALELPSSSGVPFDKSEDARLYMLTSFPENGVPYALPDGVEVEIKELCGHTNRECGDSCDDCNKFPYKRAHLKTKEVKEEKQDELWLLIFQLIREDKYDIVKSKFKVTRI